MMNGHSKLKTYHDILNSMTQYPNLYISNYFSELKYQIDMFYSRKQANITNVEKLELVNSNWQSSVDRIEVLQKECLKYKLSTSLKNETKQLTEDIGLFLKSKTDLFKAKIEINKEDTERISQLNDQINLNKNQQKNFLKNLILQIHRLQKCLLRDKTAFFIRKNNDVTLVVITNECFNSKDITNIKKL